MKPWVFELPYSDPFHLLQRLQPANNMVFFDSASIRENLGRYSYIAIEPFSVIRFQKGKSYLNDQEVLVKPFDLLQQQIASYKLDTIRNLPAFQGGVAGILSYDLLTQLENVRLPKASILPEMAIGFYDVVMAFDQVEKKAWLFSSGFPEMDSLKKEQRAKQRYQDFLRKLSRAPLELSPYKVSEIHSNFTQLQYCAAVEQAKKYITEGDIFEVCLSQKFECNYDDDTNPLSIYANLRQINPAPFAAYIKFDELCLLSASPERFLQLIDRKVEARPIKGTSKRNKDPEIDEALGRELLQSEKDRAENAMIVDLLRNDLSKVCEDHSVDVKNFAKLESYQTVHHLVSAITATLRAEFQAVDLLKAAFPGGSITGAPKIRAMEIISEIEPDNRGPYCGNAIYIGFDGSMDSSILIRTMVLHRNTLSFHAGGAVVLDSVAIKEYEETFNKANALQVTLRNVAIT